MFAPGFVKGRWLHLCIDMQNLFNGDTPWGVPWMERTAVNIEALVRLQPQRTVFTCFVPPPSPDEAPGEWREYYRKWPDMTLENLEAPALGLIPRLSPYCPPARVFRKSVYSPWACGRLHPILRQERIETLIVTGAETEVCVLAAVLGAVDLGYRVIVVRDALCSGADRTHDAAMEIFENRFSAQMRICMLEELLG